MFIFLQPKNTSDKWSTYQESMQISQKQCMQGRIISDFLSMQIQHSSSSLSETSPICSTLYTKEQQIRIFVKEVYIKKSFIHHDYK